MTRIAILGSRGYPSFYGGFETLVRHLAPYLAKKGHEVVVYGHGPGRGTAEEKFESGAVVSKYTWGVEGKATSTASFGLSASINLARISCDVALILNIANGIYLPYLKRSSVPTVVNVDGLEWERGKWGPFAKRLFQIGARSTVKYANELVMDSRALIPIWQQTFGRGGFYIPYGGVVQHNIDNDLLIKRGLSRGGYVLVIARLVPENNVDLLLDALDMLHPYPKTIIVGDSNYRHSTINRIEELHALGRVTWLGRVSDDALLEQLWGNAGVYWHGHSVGGTNPALIQALGAGCPTIALDNPFNREVLEDDDQLVGSDPRQLSSKIMEVLANPDLARKLSGRGRRVVAERYTWSAVCEEYENLLLSLVNV